jgi:hypothetical protein
MAGHYWFFLSVTEPQRHDKRILIVYIPRMSSLRAWCSQKKPFDRDLFPWYHHRAVDDCYLTKLEYLYMTILTRDEYSQEQALFLERIKRQEYLTKENLNFGLTATKYAFFAPYHSVGGFALGLIKPLVSSAFFTLAATFAVVKAIVSVIKALFNTDIDDSKKNLKTAAACIPVAFALVMIAPFANTLALIALVTSSIATALSKDETPTVTQTAAGC